MFDTYEANSYKIEIVKNNGGAFKVYNDDGTLLETVSSIKELVAEKYIITDDVQDIKSQCEEIFKEDLSKLQHAYFLYQDKSGFFSRYFKDITFTYKLSKTFSKEIHKKIIEEIQDYINSKISGKHLPITVTSNKLEVIFTVNPNSYLKSFNSMYDKIMVDGNYSLIDQALEMITAVDFIYDISINIMEIADKYQ